MDILTRLKDVVNCSGLSVRAFAIKCGIPQKTLDNQIKGLRGISIETLMSVLCSHPEISAEWLLRGEGEMLKSDVSTKESENPSKLYGVIESLQEVIDAKNDMIASLTERVKQLENKSSL